MRYIERLVATRPRACQLRPKGLKHLFDIREVEMIQVMLA